MNPFLQSPSERLSSWREFRKALTRLDEIEQLKRVSEWVSQAPISKFVLNFDEPEKWPGPWELLNEGNFDDVAKAYLMEQTLIMVGWCPSRLSLKMIRNSEDSIQTMILLVDDKWALNYIHSGVINFDTVSHKCAYLACYQGAKNGTRVLA